MVQSGDLDRAKAEPHIKEVDETKSDQLAARGEGEVREYLRQTAVNKAPIKPDDAALQAGIKDLETAVDQDKDNADALFYLAVAKEATNDLAGAKTIYAEGLDHFKNDAAQKERFEAGLNRVTAEQGVRPAGMGRAEPASGRLVRAAADRAAAAGRRRGVAPPAGAGGGGADRSRIGVLEGGAAGPRPAVRRPHEHGRRHRGIGQAADIHTKRRFSVLGKAQNPNSDPTEEIFLQTCKELKAYWQLQEKLRAAGYLDVAKGKDAPKAVDDLLAQEQGPGRQARQGRDGRRRPRRTWKPRRRTSTTPSRRPKPPRRTWKRPRRTWTRPRPMWRRKRRTLPRPRRRPRTSRTSSRPSEGVAAQKEEALKGVADALRPRFVKPEADDAAVLAAVKDVARLASLGDPRDSIRRLEREVVGLNGTLKQRWAPEQMLTFWLPLLRERGRKDLAENALIDADRVLNDDAASAAAKARAMP